MNTVFVKNENKDDFWSQILKKKLQKKNIQAAGGIYGLDGHKYTAINYFHISEPTAKAIADLFIEFEILEKEEEKEGNKYDLPPTTLRSMHQRKNINSNQPKNENDDQLQNDNDDFKLKIENDYFLIISLNSRLLYATNDKHCIFAYRCTFSFVIMLFSNYQNIAPKSPLYEKIKFQGSNQLSAELTDISDSQTGLLPQQNKPINPETYARITFEIASEIIHQGG